MMIEGSFLHSTLSFLSSVDCGQWTLKLQRWNQAHCPLSSTQTGQCLVSVQSSISAFEEAVGWRQSCSYLGPPILEPGHHNHYRSWTVGSFPFSAETLLGNSPTPLVFG